MHLFYTPDLNHQTEYTLSTEESKHCIKVLRLGADDIVYLIDGRGNFCTGKIINPNPRATLIKIIEQQAEFGKRNHYLHIAIAPTKNIERLEWFMEKATEIGIDEITPLICDRSERKEVKTERLNKVIVSAVKQSVKAYHPKLNEAEKFKTFISRKRSGQKFIAHCMDGEKSALKDRMDLRSEYIILIGPEGDFSPEELKMALTEGFFPVSLGVSRLRTETAALEACFEINFLNR
ncbi:MAG TPA: 16S rRNA (uracil(1498)-N(3))-methyltransferase [Sphingobacteriaceae bacterium]|nr:16S rRNA (uracil(1498)-N(3))-methyltransferase [Sphingobacteriaceae bacterium]